MATIGAVILTINGFFLNTITDIKTLFLEIKSSFIAFKYGYDINASASSFKELFKEFIDLFLPYFKLICLVAYSLCILKTASDIVENAEIFMKINNNLFIDFIYSTTNVLGNLFLILSFGCIIVPNLIFIKVTDKIVVNQAEYMNLKKED